MVQIDIDPTEIGHNRSIAVGIVGDAKEVLGFFLESDYGDDWAKWQEKLQEWLKENPD